MPATTFENKTPGFHSNRQAGQLTIRSGVAALLVAIADVLFYGRPLGISLAVFLACLVGASVWLNGIRAEPARRWRACLVMAAGLLPVVEDINWLSVTIVLLTTSIGTCTLAEARALTWQEHLRAALGLPFSGLFRLMNNLSRADRLGIRRRRRAGVLTGLLGWIVPLLLCAVFVTLFASANPLLENWLGRIDLVALLAQIVSERSIFWAVMLCLIWPLLRIRSLRRGKRVPAAPSRTARIVHPLNPLSDQTVLRSLALFNGLFAVQTAMDIVYLWGGASLPDGLSHASYAHRGAYPLVVTALLAAVFVVIAMRSSGPGGRAPLIRPLVLVWVGQNIVLVLSALLRLDLYVATYSLTELRVAAFVWMLLVMAGLVLILVQVLSRKSIGWLVSANALALALTLFACSFVDTAVVIANFNFRHSYEMRGEGQPIDIAYLFSLGPGVIPAVDRYVLRIAAAGHTASRSRWARSGQMIVDHRNELARHGLDARADWRSWSFRGWRLSRYLANTPKAPFKVMPESPADTPESR